MLYGCVIYVPDSDFDISTLSLLQVWSSPASVSGHLHNVQLQFCICKSKLIDYHKKKPQVIADKDIKYNMIFCIQNLEVKTPCYVTLQD